MLSIFRDRNRKLKEKLDKGRIKKIIYQKKLLCLNLHFLKFPKERESLNKKGRGY